MSCLMVESRSASRRRARVKRVRQREAEKEGRTLTGLEGGAPNRNLGHREPGARRPPKYWGREG